MKTEAKIKQISFSVTNSCNLNCNYCYVINENTGNGRWDLSPDNALKVLRKSISDEDKEIVTLFFGGEPTMNLLTIKRSLDYLEGLGKPVYAFLITNGTAPFEVYEQLIDRGVFIFVSFDGFGEYNFYRKHRDNTNIDQDIDRLIRYLVQRGYTFKVRITVHDKNVKHLPEIVSSLIDRGVKYIHFEAVSPVFGAEDFPVPKPDTYIDSVLKTIEIAEKRNAYLISSCYMNLLTPSPIFCRTILDKTYLFGVNGYVSSCLRVDNNIDEMKNFIIGKFDFEKEKLTYVPNLEDRVWKSVDVKNPCKKCRVKYICGGGCPYRNLVVTGNLDKPDPWRCKVDNSLIVDAVKRVRKSLEKGKVSPVLGNYLFEYEIYLKPTFGKPVSYSSQEHFNNFDVDIDGYDLILFRNSIPIRNTPLLQRTEGCF